MFLDEQKHAKASFFTKGSNDINAYESKTLYNLTA